MRVSSAKSKGRRLQQQVAEDILSTFPELSGNDVRSVSMGTNGEDIIMSPLAESLFPYSIECKNVERLNVWGAVTQASGNCGSSKTPMVVFTKNRSKVYAVIPWSTMILLHKRQLSDTTVAPPEENGVSLKQIRAHLEDTLRHLDEIIKVQEWMEALQNSIRVSRPIFTFDTRNRIVQNPEKS